MNFVYEKWMDTTPNDWCAIDEKDNLLDRDESLLVLAERTGRDVIFVRNWWRPIIFDR